MTTNLSDQFVAELAGLARGGFPPAVLSAAKRCLLDTLGVSLAGARILQDRGARLLDLLSASGTGFVAIGFGCKTSLQAAALINGMSAHVAELDDGERFGMVHPGAPVISALLPLAEQRKLTGQNLLAGIILGYEAAIRLARMLQPGLKDRGGHATGICGTIGAAMGVAAALGFSASEMKAALAAAATGAAGILQVIRDGSELKPYNAGQAALSGLDAALVAWAGFQGPDDVLGGEQGFLAVMGTAPGSLPSIARDGLPWAIERIYVKPYAACRHCHAPIEAALKLRAAHALRPDDIEEIQVETHRWAVRLHDHVEIPGAASAKMSVPYSVAVAIVAGRAGLAEFSPARIADPVVLALARKVKMRSSDELTALVPAKRPAIVAIATRDRQRYVERIDLPKGEPENPLSDAELLDKFMALAEFGGQSKAASGALAGHVWNVENELDKLLALL